MAERKLRILGKKKPTKNNIATVALALNSASKI